MSKLIRKPGPGRQPIPFSQTLHTWLAGGHHKTLGSLDEAFAEKSFALIFLLMMALPALPIPTGGVTHITELVTMLLSLELIIGRGTVWLPKRWLKLSIGKLLPPKAAKRLVSVIKWFERFSRQRQGALLASKPVLSFLGLVILVFAAAAFVAPPFSGLDTLPSLGVVVISLALILEDSLIVAAGMALGIVGIIAEIAAGTALYSGLTHFF